LLISIFFIIVLILVKCVQTIIHARIFCCKKQNQRHRPDCSRQRRRRQQNNNQLNNVTIDSLSSSSSCSCSYISTHSSSSDDSDSECCRNNQNNNRTRVWNAYDNIGFSTSCEPNLDLNINAINKNVINRKYDEKRFTSVNLNEINKPKVITKKTGDEVYHQISIIPTKCSYLAITKKNNSNLPTITNSNNQITDLIHSYSISTGPINSLSYLSSSNRSYTINTCQYNPKNCQNNIKGSNLRSFFKNKSFNENKIYDDVNNLFDPIIANLNNNQQINSCIFGGSSANNDCHDESLSIKFEMDNEIPPPYSQVIRESTV
jgi:hypothetical protein